MSGIITPSGLVNELTVITDPDTLSEVNVPGETVNRKIKKSVDKTYFQGTLPGRVTVNEADITSLEGLRDGTEQLNPRSFTSGRFDSQELVSGTLSVSGWYTIAETEGLVFGETSMGEISVISTGGRGASIRYGLRPTTTPRTHDNSLIEIINYAGTTNKLTDDVVGFRLVKSDSVEEAGFKVQMKIASSDAYNIQLTKNIGRSTNPGLFLVTPYLDNTPTLPDGVTVGTFLEAGEELSFDATGVTLFSGVLIAMANGADQLRCEANWEQIPKQGTGTTITEPSTFQIRDGAANSVDLTAISYTTSNFVAVGNHVQFYINGTGVGSGLNTGALFFGISGNGKLTIT